MSGPPTLTILLPLEGAPRLWVDSMTEEETRRLWDWINAQDELAELVARALELAEEAKAA